MKDNIELKYKPKWDWKMTILLVITSVVFQGCKMLMESAKLWTFNSELWTYAGIIILMVGIIDTMIEAYMGLGLFYGKSQRGGANANSGIICALGITLISSNFLFSIKNSIFRNSLIFQGLPPIKYQNLMYFPLFLHL